MGFEGVFLLRFWTGCFFFLVFNHISFNVFTIISTNAVQVNSVSLDFYTSCSHYVQWFGQYTENR